MASFWIVKDGQPIGHVGRPTAAGDTSFAAGCDDETYLAAGLYRHIDWAGAYDPRTQIISVPRFIVDESAQAVLTEYDIINKTEAEIAEYDAEQSRLIKELIKSTALELLKEIDLKSIRSIREYVVAKPDAPQYLKDYETAAITERTKLT